MVKSSASAMSADDDKAVEQLNRGAVWSDDVPDDEVSFPILSLIQMSGELAADTGKPGWWALPGFAPFQHPIIVPFRFGKSRRFSVDDGSGRQTHCYAPVGSARGFALTPEGPGLVCESCPMAQWGQREDGSRVPPACDEETRFLVVSADAMMPAQVVFRSTARQVGRNLAGILKARPGGLAVKLGSREQRNDKKQVWFVPTFEVVTMQGHPDAWQAALEGIEMATALRSIPDAVTPF